MRTPACEEPPLHHTALLYRDIEQLRRAVADFVSAAARAGAPVLAVLPAPHLELLEDVLEATGSGRVERRDMFDVGRNPSRLIPMLLEWLDGRADATRPHVISEPLWPGRRVPEAAECLRHEALINHALGASAVSVLCPFDAEHLDAELIGGAELTHPWLLDDAGVRASERYGDPLDVARGENWPQLDPDPPVFELPFNGDLWALRRTLSGEAMLSALDPQRRQDLVFAVNEAASNAVRHGDGTCRTRVWRDGDRVVSEVSTTTEIADPLAGRRLPDPGATSGRGLWLINQLCDLVELRSGPEGASLRMHVAVG